MNQRKNNIIRIIITLCVSIVSIIICNIWPNYSFAVSMIILICVVFFVFKIISSKEYYNQIKNILCSVIVLIIANKLYDYDRLTSIFPLIKSIGKVNFLIVFFIVLIVLVTIYALIDYINKGVDYQNYTSIENNHKSKYFSADEYVLHNILGDSYKNSSMNQNIDPNILNVLNYNSKSNYDTKNRMNPKTRQERKNSVKNTLKVLGAVAGIIIVIVVSLFIYYSTNIVNLIKSKDGIKELGALVSSLLGYGATFIFILFSFAIVSILLIEVFKFIISRIKSFKQDIARNRNESLIYAISISIVISLVLFAFGITDFSTDKLNDIIVNSNYLALPIFVIIMIITSIILVKVTVAVIKEISTANFSQYLKAEGLKIKPYIKSIFKLLIDIIVGGINTILSFISFIPDFFSSMLDLINEEDDELIDEIEKTED